MMQLLECGEIGQAKSIIETGCGCGFLLPYIILRK